MKNTFEFEAGGESGLFTDPNVSDEHTRITYPIPTYGALVGLCETIFWQPTFIWVVDKVRVMEPIKTQEIWKSGIKVAGGRVILKDTVLVNPRYQVQAHFEWNPSRPDLKHDRNYGKYNAMIKRYLESGGRRMPALGTRKTGMAFVEACRFGEGDGFYDNSGKIIYGSMYHSFDYASGEAEKCPLWWQPVMENGVIEFIRPEQCRKKAS